MNAVPVTTNASGHVRRQYGDFRRPCTRPSSAPPASISTSAHEPCAYMWMAEFVKNAITGQSRTPIAKATPGQRYFRHGRICHTARPTIASHRRHMPMKRMPAAKSQCTISASGFTVLLQVDEQRPGDHERERNPDEHHEKRRLDEQPPHALPVRMQERHAVGLQNPPDDAGGCRQRAEQRDDLRS